jgi:tetratricopeptide (TPR) repeat protein
MALAYAADGEFGLATQIAEKVERLAPWSPRYLRLQVYLDEEGARRQAEQLVATAREHRAEGRIEEARAAAREAQAAMPGHALAAGFLAELEGISPAVAPAAGAPAGQPTPPAPQTAAPEPSAQTAPAQTAPAQTAPGAVKPAPKAPAPTPATPTQAPSPSSSLQRAAEATALSAAALRHFLKDDHGRAREAVERALALDPSNRRALELQKILRVLG